VRWRQSVCVFFPARALTASLLYPLSESVLGLWRGITPTLIGVMPARAMYFGAYSSIKQNLSDHGLQGRLCNFASAAGAGSISATLCCPIWVVKTRLQLMPAHAEVVAARQGAVSLGMANGASVAGATKQVAQFSSVRQVAIDMYKREGPRAFFRGLTASYWGITESAIQFALYEESKSMIEEPSNIKYFLTAGACKLLASALTYPHEVRSCRVATHHDTIARANAAIVRGTHSTRSFALECVTSARRWAARTSSTSPAVEAWIL
jgi:solute carrier family 25 protein 33/36